MKEMNINILRIKDDLEGFEEKGLTSLYQIFAFLTEPKEEVLNRDVECFWMDWEIDVEKDIDENDIERLNSMMATTHDGCYGWVEDYDPKIINSAKPIKDVRFDSMDEAVCVIRNYGVLAFDPDDDLQDVMADWIDENRGVV
jgi:hypothetical protein